ncbi:MAG: lytic transglycosylase domain-containing protein [Phycisphaeraceae bacterium]
MIRRLLLGALCGVMALPAAFSATAGSGRANQAVLHAEVPETFLGVYRDAAETWEIDWALLAAIGKLECDHGRNREPGCWPPGTTNHVGARGPMQFLGSTWRSTAGPYDLDVAGPDTADGHGYATDGDGDGIADPWSIYDAVHAAARYLVDHDGRHDPYTAAKAYNAGPANPNPGAGAAYAERALALIDHYHQLASTAAAAGTPRPVPADSRGRGCSLSDPTGTGGCVTPATAHLVQELRAAFGIDLPLYCHGQRPANPNSDHPHGRACDIVVGTIGRRPASTDRAYGWQIANWLTTHARELAIRNIVWDGQLWTGTNWSTYTGGGAYNPHDPTGGHFDHLHISINP